MPLLSTRASASSAGYGDNLSQAQNAPFVPYGYSPYVPANGTSSGGLVYDTAMSGDGTSYFVVTYKYTGGTSYDWYVSAYSRNTSTGVLTYVSTTSVVTGSLSSTIRAIVSPNGANLYLSFSNNWTSITEASNFIYQYSINPTTRNITALSPSYVSAGTGAGVYWSSFSTDGKFLYVGSAATNKIFIFSRNTTTGLLTYSNVYNTPANTLPYCPRVSSDNANLYASSNGTSTTYGILQYSRNIVTGDITALSPEGVTANQQMRYLNFNPDFVGVHCNSAYNNTTYIYGRDPFTGLLGLSATQGGTVYRITYSADGNVMLGINSTLSSPSTAKLLTIQSPFQGAIDPTYGTVTPYTNPNFNVLPVAGAYLDASPSYDYYYSAFAEGFIGQWTFTGSYLKLVNSPSPNGAAVNTNYGVSLGANAAPSGLAISPDNKFLYASGYWPGSSTGTTRFGTQFSLDATTKAPTRTTSTSYGQNQGDGGLVISSDGNFLYQVDSFVNPPVIRQYSRNLSTGDLTALGTPTITLPCPNAGGGSNQRNLLGTPFLSVDQKNLYITTASTLFGTAAVPTIVQYTRNTSTGQLTYLGTTNLGSFALTYTYKYQSSAILSNDQFVYVSGINDGTYDGNISILSRNTSTGALTEISEFLSNGTAYGILLSPDNANLYVGGANFVNTYSVNTTTGSLTYIGQLYSSTKLDAGIYAMKTDGSGIIAKGPTDSHSTPTFVVIKRNTTNGNLYAITKTFNMPSPQFYAYAGGVPFGSNPVFNNAVALSPDGTKFYIAGGSVEFGTIS